MYENEQKPERVLLVALDFGKGDCEALLDELAELAKSAGGEVIATMSQKRERPDSATYVGSGLMEQARQFCEDNEIDLIIVDDELSPTQQRNMERASGVRVIDRTLLILDIFASRAQSSEGRIQVELARYRYLLPRLTGQGTGLSRQGGIGMRRGAGESKLESDRRHIRRRIHSLEEQLKEVERRRGLLGKRRQKNSLPTVAIVGYTNAGKSTLMNRLTQAGVLVENKLFATLDPTARGLKLPDGRTVILVDTVGLIRKLPHQLVEAFHSTLEAAAQADVILNLCDGSSNEAAEHLAVTKSLLEELGCSDRPVIEVLNKCDLAAGEEPLLPGRVVRISALTGEGVEQLLARIVEELPAVSKRVRLLLPFSQGGLAADIRQNGVIYSEEYRGDGLFLDCLIDGRRLEQYTPYLSE